MTFSIEIREEVDGIQEELVEVFRQAFGANEGDEGLTLFRDDQLIRHPQREDFRIALARNEDSIAGFAYGYTGRAGQWWTERMRERVPPELYAEWFEGHFEVVEVAVHPDHQRQGVGAAVLRALTKDLPHERALLTGARHDSPARRLYLREGWQPLADVDEDATLMGRDLTRCR
ncbi:GNAT family N-acetyltransferase [Flindersiella endophytica]